MGVPHMRRVCLEEHFATNSIVASWRSLLAEDASGTEPGFKSFYNGFFDSAFGMKILAKLIDTGAERLAAMDAAGIDVQILSLTAPGVQVLPSRQASEEAIRANDRLAGIINHHPERFAGFGAIAPHAVKEAVREIERCMLQLGFVGILINSHTNGEYLDLAKFLPIFEALADLNAPLYLHPQTPAADMLKSYVEYGLHGPAWGFAADAGLHALRLIASGLFDDYPGLKVILGHLGEGLPWWLSRIDGAMTRSSHAGSRRPLQHLPSEYFKNNFFVTTSGMTDPDRLLFTVKMLGAERVLFAADYPYEDMTAAVSNLDLYPGSVDDREKIFYRNADALFLLATNVARVQQAGGI